MQLTCPHCGIATEVAEKDAGQDNTCAHCGKSRTIPLINDAAAKHGYFWPDLSWRSWRNCLILVMLFIGCDTIGVGISLLLPAVQAAREAARRAQCVHNLQEIGLAMYSYHQSHGHFPPAFIADSDGKPMHSWRVLILPFLGEEKLYSQYRFDEPWDGPHNKALAEQMPAVYRCPSYWTFQPSLADYAMLVGPGTISDGPTSHCMADIKDGLSNTTMVAEATDAGIQWMEPRDLNTATMPLSIRRSNEKTKPDPCGISSYHYVGAFALLCDGSVRALSSESWPEKDLKAMTTMDGGESLPVDYQWHRDLPTKWPSKWPGNQRGLPGS